MGSLAPAAADGGVQHHYPDASDPSLVLTHPTTAEMEQTWRLNHGEWGGALDQAAYLGREAFLASTPLASDGGMVHWILTEPPCPGEGEGEGENANRKVLASCETIRKRVLYVPPNGHEVREGLNYGIGSVYTYPEFRGKKYAARMLAELGAALRTRPGEEQKLRLETLSPSVNGNGSGQQQPNGHGHGHEHGHGQAKDAEEAVCSALWSDIGKRFYASKGWPVFASDHVEFPCSTDDPTKKAPGLASLFERASKHASLSLTPVNDGNIAQLCREDEAQLRRALLRRARGSSRTTFAFAPTPDVMRWHWAREDFIVSHVFPDRSVSEVKGMVATVNTQTHTHTHTQTHTHTHTHDTNNTSTNGLEPRARMWAVWTRTYSVDTASDASKNTLYILRLVIEADAEAEEKEDGGGGESTDRRPALQLAFDAIVQGALDAARAWHCGSVHLWNPEPLVRELAAASGAPHRFVHRDVESIPSMMWYGPGNGDGPENVDWVANEKYCWC